MLLNRIERWRQERARRNQNIVEGHVYAAIPVIGLIKQRHIGIVLTRQGISPEG